MTGAEGSRPAAAMSLRGRLVVAVLAITLLPTGVAALLLGRTLAADSERQVSERLEADAAHAAQGVDQYLLEVERAALFLSTHLGDAASAERTAASELRDHTYNFPYLNRILLLDPGGRVAASSHAPDAGRPLDPEFARVADELESARRGPPGSVFLDDFSEAAPSAQERGQLLLAAPVFDAGRRRTGVLLVVASMDRIEALMEDLRARTPGGMGAFLLGGAGRVLASGDRGSAARSEAPPRIPAAQAGASGTLDLHGGGRAMFGRARAGGVPNFRGTWEVVCYAPYDVITEPAARVGRAALVLLFAAGLAAAVAGVLLARWMTRPLADLAGAAVRLGAGDLAARAPASGALEFARLAAAFNDMGARIEQADAALRRELDERRRTEDALRDSETRFQQLADSVQEVFFVEEVNPRRIAYLSPAFEAVFGIPRAAAYADPLAWVRVVHPEDAARIGAELARLYAGDASEWSTEYRVLRPDGRSLRIAATAWLRRDAAGRPARIVGTARDVTAEHEAAEALRAAREAAEAATRAKSEFLANMSHEIRTPLNAILGMAGLAQEIAADRDQKHYLQVVADSGRNLLAIVNDVLDLSKIEAGRLELAPVEFSLRNDLLPFLRPLGLRASEAGLELNWHVDPALPDRFHGDVDRLGQMLVNLVGNAIKFTPRGHIAVTVTHDGEAGKAGPVPLHFTVRDTGVGVPAEAQERLFQPFVQADASITRRFGGTGLGLSICRRLADLMGGSIRLESPARPGPVPAGEGPGTAVHVVVPLEARPSLPWTEGEALAGLRVLVVDDTPAARDLALELLRSWRCEPAAVEDGGAALRELRRAAAAGSAYHAIMLDLDLPDMSGFDVARRMLAAPEFAGTALAVVTRSHRPSTRDTCRLLGIRNLLVKPYGPSELLQMLMEATGRGGVRGRPPTPVPAGPAPRRGLRVLVVEDVAVNRELLRVLLARGGHHVAEAEDGEHALRVLGAGEHDLVLMDLQMPRLDGLEATRRIRAREAERGSPRVAIVALTAHALKGDREKCFEAGMDGYISKPVEPAELQAELARLFPGEGTAAVSGGAPAEPLSGGFGVAESLRRRVGADDAMIQRLAGMFLEALPGRLAAIRDGVRSRDTGAIRRAAHALKGTVGNFTTAAPFEALQALERRAEQGTLEGVEEDLATVEREVGRLKAEMEGLVGR